MAQEIQWQCTSDPCSVLCLGGSPWMLLRATICVAMRGQTKRQPQFCLMKQSRMCPLQTSTLTLRTPGYRASFVLKAYLASRLQ